jgi:peptidylprolyl isomerase
MIKAEQRDIVKVRYTGRLADGTVFDASPPERPLHFILGRGEVVPGFDGAVRGMYLGETKSVTIPPEEAYGAHDPQRLFTVGRDRLPAGLELEVGRQLEMTHPDGETIRLLIADLSETEVVLDANHPLAGRTLVFEIELLAVEKKPPV